MEVQVRENEWLTPHADGMEQILELAERLAATHGGTLDDDGILAIVEATGAPEEYVRLALKLRTDQGKQSFVSRARSQYVTLETSQKRYVLSGALATLTALSGGLERLSSSISMTMRSSSYGVFGMIECLLFVGAIYNVAQSRDRRTALLSGAIYGGALFMMQSLVAMLLALRMNVEPAMILLFMALGGGIGIVSHLLLNRFRSTLGMKDPAKERQDMLKQLVDLQTKLKNGEQQVTFMSIDMVGSTRMKESADPLSVEFTFNEYHIYIEKTVQRLGGRVHSTAGDGVTCAFEEPSAGFRAAKAVQSGLFEFNAFRNRLSEAVTLRVGLHTGLIVPPDSGDVRSINFSQVIDISAHLQKCAPPGGVAVSDATAEGVPGGQVGIGSERIETSGITGTLWRSKQLELPMQNLETSPAPGRA